MAYLCFIQKDTINKCLSILFYRIQIFIQFANLSLNSSIICQQNKCFENEYNLENHFIFYLCHKILLIKRFFLLYIHYNQSSKLYLFLLPKSCMLKDTVLSVLCLTTLEAENRW